MERQPLRFTIDEATTAGDEWGLNCGPAAVAAICGLSLAELRPHLGDFERKRYTNPTLMWAILRNVGCLSWIQNKPTRWPDFGLARIQWEGPWTADGVPVRVRYRHTHWVATVGQGTEIFDVNCLCVGGWVPLAEWSGQVVPWLLSQCEPKADGKWHITHSVEVVPPLPTPSAPPPPRGAQPPEAGPDGPREPRVEPAE